MESASKAAMLAGAGLVVAVFAYNSSASPDGDRQQSELHEFQIDIVADGFEHPWGMTFLPDGRLLVTERVGRLSVVDPASGERREVEGVPAVAVHGQGGLLDVVLHPQFESNGWLYLSYAAGNGEGYATHIARFSFDGERLAEPLEPFIATPFLPGGQHFGSRLVFDREGYLFATVGDRGERERSQQLDTHQGATLRLTDSLEVPQDNPFVARDDAQAAIYSYGHRNVQGMAVHPHTGRIWQNEHGPRGGDEINALVAGADYGWPQTSYGREYADGSPIGPDPDQVEGTEPPLHYWEDSFAPSGMAFYTGDEFPKWQGDVFVGSLAQRHLVRLTLEGDAVAGEEPLLQDYDWRIRDVRTGPDGLLYILIDSDDAPLARLRPVD